VAAKNVEGADCCCTELLLGQNIQMQQFVVICSLADVQLSCCLLFC
jgi:hypothetical protein